MSSVCSNESDPIVVVCEEKTPAVEPVIKARKGRKTTGTTTKTKDTASEKKKPQTRKKKSSDSSESAVPTKTKSSESSTATEEEVPLVGKRHVKSPVERIDNILDKLENGGVTKEVVSQLLRLRKQLEGAKIKQAHAPRTPNEYNLWMKNKMAELKDSEMPPKERFAHCIKLWNEEKAGKVVVGDVVDVVPSQ